MSSDFPKRLVSLDIFRGLTIAAMILVGNLSAWTDTPRFPTLTHAEWNGCTWVDLIFPFFIFIVGVTSVFSLDKRVKTGESLAPLYRHILIRTTLLVRYRPGGVQLFHLRLAFSGDLSTRSDAEEHLGDFPLSARRQ